MKKSPLLFRIVIVVSCIALAYGKGNPEAARNYEKALKQIKSGNLKVDFKALRLDCAASKDKCEVDAESRTKVKALLNEKKFAEAIKEANKALEKIFPDIDMHISAYAAYAMVQNKDKAEFHKTIIKGLLDSIQENKRGRSDKDAFVIINLEEENVYLQFSKLQVKQRKLLFKNGHSYDVVECMDPDSKEEVTIYFNLDIPLPDLSDWYNRDKTE